MLDYSISECTIPVAVCKEAGMDKSIYTREYELLLKLLREKRTAAGISQVELAEMLGTTQSFVSKCERGDRRLDVIQLRTLCRHLGTTLAGFVGELEDRLAAKGSRTTKRG